MAKASPSTSASQRQSGPSPQSPSPRSTNPLQSLVVLPPSWRRDLTREIDLIEEVGRIHGYDAIPEDVGVPMVPSARRRDDRVLERIRHVLTATGFDEALTSAWSMSRRPRRLARGPTPSRCGA